MVGIGLSRLYWGFVFVLLGFKIQGFDILPDVIGYLLFASGFYKLSAYSKYFITASKYNLPMIILSLLSIYQPQGQNQGVNFGPLGVLGIPIAIAAVVLNLLVVYNLFNGIKEMSNAEGLFDLAAESDDKWNLYKILQIAILLSFIFIFIPVLAFIYVIALFIASIGITISILGFINRCKSKLTQ